jgi:hypothetical protein
MLCAVLVAHGSNIPRAYRVVAAEYGVPVPLLYAIALQESRAVLGASVRQPWPWTLNVAGVGYRYGSRAAAYAALNNYVKRGETRVDVGLMQVHWRFHHGALGSTWTGLHPWHNLRVGAAILRDCFRRTGSWTAASGCYHSMTPERSSAYAASVAALMAAHQ